MEYVSAVMTHVNSPHNAAGGGGWCCVCSVQSPRCGKEVKESRNRPGVAQRVPGGLDSQIS